MSRKIRCIAMTLALSVLLAVAAQAAPTRTSPRESAPEVGLFTKVWEWLVSRMQEEAPTPVKLTSDSTSHLDPNGGH